MFYKGKKVLVAGGTGLIGRQVVDLLLSQGATVRISSMDDPSRAHPEAEFISMDLTVLENCRRACRGMDYVFNLLGVKGAPGVTTNKPASFLYPTAILALNMLEGARLEEVEGYVYTSSVAVYQPAPVFREQDVWTTFPSPNDWYGGWAKRLGELQVEACRIEYGWDRLAVVRPANVYGPYDNFDGENAMVVPSLIKRASSGEPTLTVWGDGTPRRDFIHARDVARGMLLVGEKMPAEPVNLGSGEGISIRALVEAIVANLDQPPEVVWDTSKPRGDEERVMDISRLRALGFEPQITLEEGVRQVMAWYRDNREITGLRYDIFA